MKKENQKLLTSEGELMHVIQFLKKEIRCDFPDFVEMMEFDNLSEDAKNIILDC